LVLIAATKGGEIVALAGLFLSNDTHHAPPVVEVGRRRGRARDVLEQLGDVAVGVRPVFVAFRFGGGEKRRALSRL
jgi:hypothetical protein